MTVLAGHVLKNCTGYRIIRLFRMLKKSSVDLNVCRSVISLYSLLRKSNEKATAFMLLIHVFQIIPQVVRSFNVTESHCNLKSASNGLLRNTWNVKVILARSEERRGGKECRSRRSP